MLIGAFGGKSFEVSQNKIYTFDGLSVSEGLNVEMQETEGGKPATYVKGYKEMSISFSIILKQQFCNVLEEIDWWLKKMRSKKPEYLTLGKKTFGSNKFLLINFSVANTVITPNGDYISATINLSFNEWTKAGYKKEENSNSGSSGGSSGGSSSGSSSKLTYWFSTSKQIVVGDKKYVNKKTLTVDGKYYYEFEKNKQYIPTSYLVTVKIDGGKNTAFAFPPNTPVYKGVVK